MRRVSTTCTGFSFQIVHFLDRLWRLHQRIFGRTPRGHQAFRPNVHSTCGHRYPPIAPQVQGRRPRACTSVVADSPMLACRRTRTHAGRNPFPNLTLHGGTPCTSAVADPCIALRLHRARSRDTCPTRSRSELTVHATHASARATALGGRWSVLGFMRGAR